tara:strand:+ start:378 stop:902 length:525 start_codon:yes stop_codon:yes gene_type:complete
MLLHVLTFALLLPSRPPAARLRSTAMQMQVFPAEEDNSSLEAIVTIVTPQRTRGEQMATLLSALVDKPDAAAALLQAATPMLLEPFRPGPQEPGSIFADDASLDEKIEVYRTTLEARIGSARKRETKEALCKLRDHTVQAALAAAAGAGDGLSSAERQLSADDGPSGVEEIEDA